MSGALDLSGIEVLEAVLVEVAGVEVGTTWPCPACGERRPIATSASARVRNVAGPSLERWVRLCEVCASPFLDLVAPDSATPTALDGRADRQPDPALEPWLADLAGSTAVRRLMRSVEGVIRDESKQTDPPGPDA